METSEAFVKAFYGPRRLVLIIDAFTPAATGLGWRNADALQRNCGSNGRVYYFI